jgi:peptidoglycan biosynthesis protein MviN/MurJ (putative lipid II flippase)
VRGRVDLLLVLLAVVLAVVAAVQSPDDTGSAVTLLLLLLAFPCVPLLFLWAVLTIVLVELDRRSSRASERPEP